MLAVQYALPLPPLSLSSLPAYSPLTALQPPLSGSRSSYSSSLLCLLHNFISFLFSSSSSFPFACLMVSSLLSSSHSNSSLLPLRFDEPSQQRTFLLLLFTFVAKARAEGPLFRFVRSSVNSGFRMMGSNWLAPPAGV